MSKLEKVLFILMGLVLVFGAVWVFQGWQNWRGPVAAANSGNKPIDYPQAQATTPDPCQPLPRYTEESWREHMSHHPNEYKQCLGN